MIFHIYNKTIAVDERIDGLPFLKLEDFLQLVDQPPRIFLKALEVINTLNGELII